MMKVYSERLGIDVEYNARCMMKDAEDDAGWRHDVWSLAINGIQIPYKTGLGLRIAPDIDDVLNCLCSDMQLGLNSFDDFCSELGYDTDSRKALESYLECQRTDKTLKSMKLGKTFAEMQEAFLDY